MRVLATAPGVWHYWRVGAVSAKGANRVPLQIKNAVLIANPRAGSGRRMHQLDEARRILWAGGIETELRHTAAPGEAVALARDAVEQSRQLVIVCGGDGTINEAANGLAGSQVALAILPAGTANVLAKELAIPWNLPRAARHLLASSLKRIALGLAVPAKSSGEPRYFLSVAGAGPDAAIVAAVSQQLKDQAGILAYWHQGFRQLLAYKFPPFRVQTNERALDASLVVVGRTKHYGGPFQITTEADLLDPCFELAVVTTRNRWRYLSYLPVLWAGQLRRARHVQFWKTNSVECLPGDSDAVMIQVDGEPAGRIPAKFWIVPDALTLAIPDPM